MLSKKAFALFRLHVARHELMVVGNTFAGGQDRVYHVTREGFEHKAKLRTATAPVPGSAAAPRR
jgi:hypothetical protein